MNQTHPCRFSAAFALALLGTLAAEDALRCAPEGTLTRTFGETTRWELTSLVELTEERELPAEQIEFRGETTRELELVDVLGPLADGRPEHLARSFEHAAKYVEVELDLQGLEELYELELEAPLEGRTVRFERDADEEAFTASSEDGLDALHLERLAEDCDLRALLPEAAQEGDRWSVPASDLAALFTPAGRLIFTTDEVPDGPYAALTPVDLAAVSFLSLADAAQELEGRLDLTWGETRREGQLAQAVLALELQATVAGALDDDLARLVEDMGAGGKRDVQLDFVWDLEGRGQLIWDLTAGHFHAYELELEGALALEMTWSANGGRAGAQVGFATETTLQGSAVPE